jgi:hypothetical protein
VNIMKIKIFFLNVYFGNHRVDRVLGFLAQASELGFPHPLTSRRVCPPLLVRGERKHSLGGEGGVPSSDEVTDTVVLLVYMYFVLVAGQDTVCTNRLFSI